MRRFQTLLSLRLKQKENAKAKISALAERSTNGNLSSFSGVFRVVSLNDDEKDILYNILSQYKTEELQEIDNDLSNLSSITSEIKAITNQAVILHGERIKKAQQILKNYKEGAFTAWLFATYGNRQTPYNFLLYYEFYTSIPETLRVKVDQMPRQAIYTLASRTGSFEKKQELIETHAGLSKQELLSLIRKLFPLDQEDKRNSNIAMQSLSSLKRLAQLFDHPLFLPDEKQKRALRETLLLLSKKLEE